MLEPAHVEMLRDALLEVMTKSRRGDVERGFSMTLGRVFDPADSGLLLAVCCVAQFMVILDLSIVNVALPSIQSSLGFSSPDLQWVVDAYSITFAGFLLLGGRASAEMVRTGGGSIINMSSGASLKGDRTRTAYGVSKAGVNTLTMYVATSHGKQNIRVNAIVPGLIITDAVRAHLNDEILSGLGRAVLTTHLGEPDDIANTVVFLASDESRYITGQLLSVDGGMSAHVGSAGRDE